MNRRGFLKRLGIGLVGTAVAVGVPFTVVEKWAPDSSLLWAQKYLTAEYNKRVRGSGSAHQPAAVLVSWYLMDAYEAELTPMYRFVETDAALYGIKIIMFKGLRMLADDSLSGIELKWLSKQEYQSLVDAQRMRDRM